MYTLKERKIYEYQDHEGKCRFGDPIAISIRFMDAVARMGTTPDDLLKKIVTDDSDSGDVMPMPGSLPKDGLDEFQRAVFQLAEAVSAAFKIPVLDEETGIGIPRIDLVLMYIHFLGFQGEVKKNTEDGLSGSLPSDGPLEDLEDEE